MKIIKCTTFEQVKFIVKSHLTKSSYSKTYYAEDCLARYGVVYVWDSYNTYGSPRFAYSSEIPDTHQEFLVNFDDYIIKKDNGYWYNSQNVKFDDLVDATFNRKYYIIE